MYKLDNKSSGHQTLKIKANPISKCHSKVYDNILQVIGNTPLVRLNRVPKDHGLECEIYAKCEFLNPGGSIKDRIAYTMMSEAEERGLATEGSRFVEPSSGNTGIGVSLAAAVNGFDCTIVTPDKNSDEKMNTMRLLGASVVQTPSEAPYHNPENFMSVVKRLLAEDPKALSLDQYSNNMNPLTHYEHTAEEIISTLGHFDMIVLGAGTGGTLTGIAHKVKEVNPSCVVVAVDPLGSIMFEPGKPKPYFVEGIGGDFIPKVLDKSLYDRLEQPNDSQSFNMAREIIRKEGLLCGGSSGAVMYSAINAARALNLGRGKRVVVVLSDGIRNYMTKFVSEQWMEANLFKPPPNRSYLPWWNKPISSLKINTAIPRIKIHQSCREALMSLGNQHDIALIVTEKGYLRGVISKSSLLSEATNPKSEKVLNLNDPIEKYLIKTYYKIIENKESSTIGLVSRILDIAPFVIVVEPSFDDTNNKGIRKEVFIPKGAITANIVLDSIIHQTGNGH